MSKDVWGLFVDFVRTIEPDYSNYDEEGESLCLSRGAEIWKADWRCDSVVVGE